ncbi:HNH endonuclease [Peptostreptococcus sp. D1]|uniref:HNH endonuclease n=1 Tax=Peptostreptococcus sp. D1 TaxID=72304 RepID=UPI0008F338AA|nr:HNH endonuclease [Peptostreptococcus sp. D1]SFE88241.1 HNH endonuclease [Peptostreptococcus sp. D1]
MALTRVCKCGNKVELGKECDRCGYNRHSHYDIHIRDKKLKQFYKSKEWTKLSHYIRQRYNHIDVYQLYKYNRIVLSEMVHHIIPIKDDWDRRLDPDNLIPLSSSSHNEIERIYSNNEQQKRTLISELFRQTKQFRGRGK